MIRIAVVMAVVLVGCVDGVGSEPGLAGERGAGGPDPILGFALEQDGAALEVEAEVDYADGVVELRVLGTDGGESLVEGDVVDGVWSARVPLADPCAELGTEVEVGLAADAGDAFALESIDLDGVGYDLGDPAFVVVWPEVTAVCTGATELRVTVAVDYEVSIAAIDGGGLAFLQPNTTPCADDVPVEDCVHGFAGGSPYELALPAGVWTATQDGALVALVFEPVE